MPFPWQLHNGYEFATKIVFKSKISRREYLSETITVILVFDYIEYFIDQIRKENEFAKSTIYNIIKRVKNYPDESYRKARRIGKSPKFDERAERRLIKFISLNPFSTIEYLFSSSKSDYRMHFNIIRRYLVKNEIYIFRSRRKFFLTLTYKKARLKFAKIHRYWKIEN
jgi:hypothetical protein